MVAFSIFWRSIYWYWIFYLISFILTYCFLSFLWKKKVFKKFHNLQNLIETDLESLFIILILWVLIWWRLWHVIIYDLNYFINNPIDILKIREWWMSFIWWIIWVLILVSIFLKKRNFSRKEYVILLDLLACILPLCIALWRLGNFLNQELYWIVFTNPLSRSQKTISTLTSLWFLHIYPKIDSSVRINTNLLSIVFEGLVLFIILLTIFIKQLRQKQRKIWKISMIFFIRYSVIRFILEYVRQDSQYEFIWPFSKSQRFFLCFTILWVIISIYISHNKQENL